MMHQTIAVFGGVALLFACVAGYPRQASHPPRGYYNPPPRDEGKAHPPVYTASRIRDESDRGRGNNNPNVVEIEESDNDPYPATASLGTAKTYNGAEPTEVDNSGFVPTLDFGKLLREVESNTNKGLALGSESNPLYSSSNSQDSYANFFGSNNKDPFADFAVASSDQSAQNKDDKDLSGFVDPNVQFRSLFDQSQTGASGFAPKDFLSSQDDGTKGEQTRTFPSFTYTGRDEEPENKKFRSNYRNNNDYDDDYLRKNYNDYDGPEYNYYDEPRNYNENSNLKARHTDRYFQEPQKPEASPSETPSKAATSNNEGAKSPKCKKVERSVDYSSSDFGSSFTDPDSEYDPSPPSTQGRYKRQSRNPRASSNKRPMTCYVCEDDQGRYAEKCSYDSTSTPKKGEYFHSSSTSFSDNGKKNNRPSSSSGKARQRRTPSPLDLLEASPTTASTSITLPPTEATTTSYKPESSTDHLRLPIIENDDGKDEEDLIEESEPKVIGKRQSGGHQQQQHNNGNRFAGVFQNNNNNKPTENINAAPTEAHPTEFNIQTFGLANTDYGLPRTYIGKGNSRETEANDRESDDGYPKGGDDFEYQPEGNTRNSGRPGDFEIPRPPPLGYDFDGPKESSPDFDDGPPSRGKGGRGGNKEYDFSIPSEYDPDIQLENENTERATSTEHFTPQDAGREGPREPEDEDDKEFARLYESATTASSPTTRSRGDHGDPGHPSAFDTGFDDYVKEHFPEVYRGPGDRGGRDSRNASPYHSNNNGPDEGGPFKPSQRGPPHPPNRSGPPPNRSGPPPGFESHPPSYMPRQRNGPQHQGPPPFSSPPSFSGGPPQFNYFHRPGRGETSDNSRRGPRRGPPPPPPSSSSDDDDGPSFNPPRFGFPESSDSNPDFRPSHVAHNEDHLNKMVGDFGRSDRDRSGCHRVQKGDMSCYVCKDASGMNKEECMYASNDPRNQRMAYHEVTEYSSDAPKRILPEDKKVQVVGTSLSVTDNNPISRLQKSRFPDSSRSSAVTPAANTMNAAASTSASASIIVRDPVSSGSKHALSGDGDFGRRGPPAEQKTDQLKNNNNKPKSITRVESTLVSRKVIHENNVPFSYDFDY